MTQTKKRRKSKKKLNKKVITKNPVGAPVKFNLQVAVDRIMAYIAKSSKNVQHVKSISHICVLLGISRDTWYDHKKRNVDNKELLDTIKRLEAIQDAWWIDVGLAGKVNATAWIFCRKNIAKWRDIPLSDSEDNRIIINYSVIK